MLVDLPARWEKLSLYDLFGLLVENMLSLAGFEGDEIDRRGWGCRRVSERVEAAERYERRCGEAEKYILPMRPASSGNRPNPSDPCSSPALKLRSAQ